MKLASSLSRTYPAQRHDEGIAVGEALHCHSHPCQGKSSEDFRFGFWSGVRVNLSGLIVLCLGYRLIRMIPFTRHCPTAQEKACDDPKEEGWNSERHNPNRELPDGRLLLARFFRRLVHGRLRRRIVPVEC